MCLDFRVEVNYVSSLLHSRAILHRSGVETQQIISRTLDLITIVVPPDFPVTVTIALIFAQRGLQNHDIYCINPSAINVCGVINVACFDKEFFEEISEDHYTFKMAVSAIARSDIKVSVTIITPDSTIGPDVSHTHYRCVYHVMCQAMRIETLTNFHTLSGAH
ncbi:hypothetical protein EG68_07244 [Paragonimus skrjabini miyazakii]|uniref:Uncharacterized protein n=1 Tax=Paragonimus skrjabini miyazakii TaxID=59628 RepID=A0A8S9YQL1_9TREM|nr:hypothetical protein EG68_07244 [Paragonimus skrjabini miyazakii]